MDLDKKIKKKKNKEFPDFASTLYEWHQFKKRMKEKEEKGIANNGC